MYQKRFLVCILGGGISAVMCIVGRQLIFGFPEITWNVLSMTIANRLFLGFVIGISCWRVNYLMHGALLGLLLSLTVSIGFFPNDILPFFLYTSAGIFYGVFIEWLSTIVFKSPMRG